MFPKKYDLWQWEKDKFKDKIWDNIPTNKKSVPSNNKSVPADDISLAASLPQLSMDDHKSKKLMHLG